MPSKLKDSILNYDLDKVLNPLLPPSPVKYFPKSISWWLGYRSEEHKEPAELFCHLFAFLGSLVGLLCIGAVYRYAPGIAQYHPPAIIASLGASAVLEYGAIHTPLAQPRASLVGHTLSAIIGVAISKAFQGYSNFSDIQWVAGAVACAVAITVMNVTNTLHPPGGATAVIACVETPVIAMGWWLVPVIMTAMCIMLAVGLINNNIMRKFPNYWWTSDECGSFWTSLRRKSSDEEAQEEESQEKNDEKEDDNMSEITLHYRPSNESYDQHAEGILISPHHLTIPAGLVVGQAELAALRALQQRLHETKTNAS